MMTYYQQVTPLQSPFDLRPDETGRNTVVFNIQAMHEPTSRFVEEIAGYLNREELYDSSNDQCFEVKAFAGGRAGVPRKGLDNNYVRITKVFGPPPVSTQDKFGKYQVTVAQVMCAANKQVTAEKMAYKAYEMLDFSNMEVEPISYE